MMRKNIGSMDSSIRGIFGVGVAYAGHLPAGGFNSIGGILLAFLALYLFLTAAFEYSPEYSILRIDTRIRK